jgi:glycosyltransferase involved in cell wall biosynthesis
MSPAVSIIMPAYNAEKFIREAIDAILNQTFDDFELIILNDGSTDSTKEIIESYKDDRIVLINKKNEGVAKTLNAGLKSAKGRYIWRHDADDISLPRKLEAQFEFLENHPDIALCATQVAFMTERGKVAWNKRQPKNDWLGEKNHRIVKFEDFNPFSPITHGTVLFRSSILESVPSYREAFITSEDIDMWLRMMEHAELAVINECLSLHRLSSASATAVHGWKNDFYRERAKAYYLIRKNGEQDELERKGRIVEPQAPKAKPIEATGKNFRGDLLGFPFAVALDASDGIECIRIAKLALIDGWKNAHTYKALLLSILPDRIVQKGVRIKASFPSLND